MPQPSFAQTVVSLVMDGLLDGGEYVESSWPSFVANAYKRDGSGQGGWGYFSGIKARQITP